MFLANPIGGRQGQDALTNYFMKGPFPPPLYRIIIIKNRSRCGGIYNCFLGTICSHGWHGCVNISVAYWPKWLTG